MQKFVWNYETNVQKKVKTKLYLCQIHVPVKSIYILQINKSNTHCEKSTKSKKSVVSEVQPISGYCCLSPSDMILLCLLSSNSFFFFLFLLVYWTSDLHSIAVASLTECAAAPPRRSFMPWRCSIRSPVFPFHLLHTPPHFADFISFPYALPPHAPSPIF